MASTWTQAKIINAAFNKETDQNSLVCYKIKCLKINLNFHTFFAHFSKETAHNVEYHKTLPTLNSCEDKMLILYKILLKYFNFLCTIKKFIVLHKQRFTKAHGEKVLFTAKRKEWGPDKVTRCKTPITKTSTLLLQALLLQILLFVKLTTNKGLIHTVRNIWMDPK